MKLYGFSILENALVKNTCFRESVSSLLSMTEDTHVFIQKSVDGTEKILRETNNFHIHNIIDNDHFDVLQFLIEVLQPSLRFL